MIDISVAIDTFRRTLCVRVSNIVDTSVTIGNLTLANIKFQNMQSESKLVTPWLLYEKPNTNGIRTLACGETAEYVSEYLIDYMFPQVGTYSVWAIYNSIGYRTRYSSIDDGLAELRKVDEFRCHSPYYNLDISSDDLEFNRANIRTFEPITVNPKKTLWRLFM